MHHLNTTPCPEYQRHLISGVLIISHVAGADPLSFLSRCGGGLRGIAHISPPQVFSEYPKAVLVESSMF